MSPNLTKSVLATLARGVMVAALATLVACPGTKARGEACQKSHTGLDPGDCLEGLICVAPDSCEPSCPGQCVRRCAVDGSCPSGCTCAFDVGVSPENGGGSGGVCVALPDAGC